MNLLKQIVDWDWLPYFIFRKLDETDSVWSKRVLKTEAEKEKVFEVKFNNLNLMAEIPILRTSYLRRMKRSKYHSVVMQ